MLLVLAVTITPIDTIALHYLLSIHLVQNVVLAEWAPLLFVLSIPPALAAARAARTARCLRLRSGSSTTASGTCRGSTTPRSGTRTRSCTSSTRSTSRRACCSGGRSSTARLSSGAKAAYVFAAFVLASPIGLVMALVPEPLYDFYVEGPGLWGLDPLADQQIAGVTMSLTETVVFFAVFAVYFGRFFAEQDAVT